MSPVYVLRPLAVPRHLEIVIDHNVRQHRLQLVCSEEASRAARTRQSHFGVNDQAGGRNSTQRVGTRRTMRAFRG